MNDAAWALTPSAIALLGALIDAGHRTVVECGSGESTVAIATKLAERGGGSLHSLEHDPGWAARTRARLARAGVAEQVALIDAPLRPHPIAEPDCGWYDTAALAKLPHAIDLLLVDGPPGPTAASGEGRYPALPLLATRLAPGALVILDDIHRPGERSVLRRWERELAIEFEPHPRERIAIGVFCDRQEPVHGRNA